MSLTAAHVSPSDTSSIPPPRPARRRRIFLPLVAGVIGVAGLTFAVAPGTFHNAHFGIVAGAVECPQSIRDLRNSWDITGSLESALFYVRMAFVPRPRPAGSHVDAASGLPLWDASDLMRYKGDGGSRITLGVCARVYDVTELGSRFYGPGKGYSIFAGKEVTRALALGSLEVSDVALGGDVSGIDDESVKTQCEFYNTKYGPPIGALVAITNI